MDLATLIAVVLVVLAVGAVLLGATIGAPRAAKEPPKAELVPAAVAEARAGQIQTDVPTLQGNGSVAVGRLLVRPPRPAPAIPASVLAGGSFLALVIVALGAYFVWLPSQQTFATDRQLRDSVQEGAALYTQDCASCHGPTGQGQIGPNLHIYSAGRIEDPNGIAARNKANPDSQADMDKLRTMVIATITQGRSGTVQQAFGKENGGPLSASQISALADLIMTNGWDAVVPAPPAPAAPAAGEAPAAGADAVSLIQKYDCASCHTIATIQGATGTVGPNLSAEATVPNIPASSGNLTNTPENMQQWIFDAPAVKPGTIMPDFSGRGMTQAEAKTIAAYIETLQPPTPIPAPPSTPVSLTGAGGAPAAPAAAATPAAAAAPATGPAAAQALIAQYGCGACHTISGIQGAVGTIGPDLSKEGSQPKIPRSSGNLDNTPANLQKWIFNAPSVKAGIVMPDFSSMGMTADQAKTIADYLSSLK